MNVSEAIREFESHEFVARLSAASDLRTFLRAANQEPAVQSVLRELASVDAQGKVLERCIELGRESVDPRYQNPWDSALAVYLWLLQLTNNAAAQAAAEVVGQAPQLWWARVIARQILLGDQFRTAAGSAEPQLAIEPALRQAASEFAADTPESGEAFFLPRLLARNETDNGHRMRTAIPTTDGQSTRDEVWMRDKVLFTNEATNTLTL